jgi:hypothetical protein
MMQSVRSYIHAQGVARAVINAVLNPAIAWLGNQRMAFVPLSIVRRHGIRFGPLAIFPKRYSPDAPPAGSIAEFTSEPFSGRHDVAKSP